MSKLSVAQTAGKACKWLEITTQVVVVVGVLLAAGSVLLGFTVDEPWTYGAVTATESWHSITAGVVGAIVILIQTAITASVLLGLDAVAEDIYEKNAAGVSDTAG